MRRFFRRLSNLLVINRSSVNVWLDRERPAPWGWYWAVSSAEAIDVLVSCHVENLNMGVCGVHLLQELGACRHFWGLDFWPENKPTVHSWDPIVRAEMLQLIEEYGGYDADA